uniref:Exostosin GT47 domain-containing protein n=2 Tax=Davidia involucrata TaxID=16924 RepID=A0A5B6YX28_DAVIN
MEIGIEFRRLCHVQIQRFLLILVILAAVVVLFQLFALPYEKYISSPSVFVMVGSGTHLNGSKLTDTNIVHGVVNNTIASGLEEKSGYENETEGEDKDYNFASDDDGEVEDYFEIDKDRNSRNELTFERGSTLDKSLTVRNVRATDNGSTQEKVIEFGLGALEQGKESDNDSIPDKDQNVSTYSILGKVHNQADFESLPLMSPNFFSNGMQYLDADSRTSLVSIAANVSPTHNDKQDMDSQPKDTDTALLQTVSVTLRNNSLMTGNSIMKKRGMKTTSISQMYSLLLQNSVSSNSMRRRWSSARDRELQHAKLQIENAPIIRDAPGLYDSLFRNFSMFKRSYELMERMLKVYIYMEGEKPIFHQPHLRGIYASEGWFMKLIEGSKQFVVRDPRKAHLLYLPFSLRILRNSLHEQKFSSQKDMEKYLKDYVDLIAKKYRFWNRTRGADHFIVACHDWAPKITRNNMGSCIRALCNSNVARGFKLGKDVSLPVTYVRSAQDPLKDLGGNPPSERPILAFFAGSMHGYLRPILLQYWKNKEPDMKIFGPMPRDIEGKTKYRNYMKSSKYCICARGYEVHTPRVVESILYECVPVIISDNYVPPFFEVLDWETFSVFIQENDIPNLRNILLSIPEEKYLAMQQRVKMVQQHFLWHKKPVKYDLFHMVLHSVWYNRIFQVKPR